MKVTIDNPRVRRGFTCPLCLGSKDRGLVACWPCFRGELKYNPKAEELVAEFENFLASQEQRT